MVALVYLGHDVPVAGEGFCPRGRGFVLEGVRPTGYIRTPQQTYGRHCHMVHSIYQERFSIANILHTSLNF